MAQPEHFIINENKVCLLKMAIYGLKQALRVWNVKVKNVLLKAGLRQSENEACILYKNEINVILIVALYVDDFLVLSNDDCV